jgi:malate dehydrogenase (oxaloacetate-decarboxylating)(NADP+)
MREGVDFDIVYDIDEDRYATCYHQMMQRRGLTFDDAMARVRSETTLQASLMVKLGDADTLICGAVGRFHQHLRRFTEVSGKPFPDVHLSTLNIHILKSDTLFICDTQVTLDPSAQEIAKMTIDCAREVQRFGIQPKVALLSHSNFGNRESPSSRKMREALQIIRQLQPELEVDGEMQADSALSEHKRKDRISNSTLSGRANCLIMPNLDAGNITSNVLREMGEGVTIGPILLGCSMPGYVVNSSITVRGLVNMTVMSVVQALQSRSDPDQ